MASLKKVLTSNLTNGAYTSEVINQSLRPDSICMIYCCASDALAASWASFVTLEVPGYIVEARADASAPWCSLGAGSWTASSGYAGNAITTVKAHPFMRLKMTRDGSSSVPVDVWMGVNV